MPTKRWSDPDENLVKNFKKGLELNSKQKQNFQNVENFCQNFDEKKLENFQLISDEIF